MIRGGREEKIKFESEKDRSHASSARMKDFYDEESDPGSVGSKAQKDRIQLETELAKYREAGVDRGRLLEAREACAKAWVELMEKCEEADYYGRKLWRIKQEREFDEELRREQRAHEEASARWLKVAEEVQKRNQMLPMLEILRKENDSLLKSLSS